MIENPDELLLRCVHHLNYATDLRAIAEVGKDASARDALVAAAHSYDEIAASLNLVLRAKANLEG